jgi:hypothetical protein
MSYTAGDNILDDEYNDFVSSASRSIRIQPLRRNRQQEHTDLGESAISTVAAGNTITAAQWNSLWTAMTTSPTIPTTL